MHRLPVIGNWYRRADRPQPFQVVAVDGAQQTVEVEYFDGTLDEWPLAHWRALVIEEQEAPQDWTGPFDSVQEEDEPERQAPEDLIEPLESAQDQADDQRLDELAADLAEARQAPVPRRRR